jgi:hypothetical protein
MGTRVVQVNVVNFRTNLKTYTDLADKGVRVILKRYDKNYILIPVDDADLWLTPAIEAKIDKAIKQVKNGKYVEYDDALKQKLFGDVL